MQIGFFLTEKNGEVAADCAPDDCISLDDFIAERELTNPDNVVVDFLSVEASSATLKLLEAACALPRPSSHDSFLVQFEELLAKVFEAGRRHGRKEAQEKMKK